MKQQMICSNCGQISSGKTTVRGSLALEIVLWFFLLIPGIIYSVWRSSSRHKTCPACGSTNLVPLDTPNGKRLLEEQGKTIADVPPAEPEKISVLGMKLSKGNFWGLVIIIVVIVILLLSH